MKSSKCLPLSSKVVAPEEWKLFDNCPVCKLIKASIKEGREISQNELEKAFKDAGEEKFEHN